MTKSGEQFALASPLQILGDEIPFPSDLRLSPYKCFTLDLYVVYCYNILIGEWRCGKIDCFARNTICDNYTFGHWRRQLWATRSRAPQLLTIFFGLCGSRTQCIYGSLFSITLKTCEIGNERRSIRLRKHYNRFRFRPGLHAAPAGEENLRCYP